MIRRLLLALVAVSLLCGQAMAAEKFIVATDCTWPPMEMLDANKQPIGFDVDFITAVGKAAGFEVDVRNIAWDGIFGGVATGQYDIVASATTITEERQKQFDFSDPYYEVAQAVVLPTGKTIKTLADLKGKKVGGQIGTTGVFVIRKAGVAVAAGAGRRALHQSRGLVRQHVAAATGGQGAGRAVRDRCLAVLELVCDRECAVFEAQTV